MVSRRSCRLGRFQSTHPWRVWHRPNVQMRTRIHFNPHTREGCDTTRTIIAAYQKHFNPHTREGCDYTFWGSLYVRPHFNPHTREGCDQACWPVCGSVSYFNPHTREGCDNILLHPRAVEFISIHTPVKGVTVLVWNPALHYSISIHTPVKGVTVSAQGQRVMSWFQSTHPWRVWRKYYEDWGGA